MVDGEKKTTGRTQKSKSRESIRRSRLSGIHGHGLGIGEITVAGNGEGDGCHRCGCPDEEVCCPCFWHDNGVPPIWPLSWFFDPKNKYINDNKHARMFGNLGFKFFDEERKAFMGIALAVTVFAIVVTVFGAFSLSDDDAIIRATSWGIAKSRYVDSASGQEVGQLVYLGLRKVVVYSCFDTDAARSEWDDDGVIKAWGHRGWSECEVDAKWWEQVKCSNDDDGSNGEEGDWSDWSDGKGGSYLGWPCEPVRECQEAAVNSQFGAFSTCATLVFALIGCLTRMRKMADTNFQKMIGCIPDTFGIFLQAQALLSFSAGCYDGMPPRDVAGNKLHYHIGSGFWAYAFCWFAAVVRATVHYLTPVPGGGAGCHCVDMALVVVDMSDQIAETAQTTIRRVSTMTGVPSFATSLSFSRSLSACDDNDVELQDNAGKEGGGGKAQGLPMLDAPNEPRKSVVFSSAVTEVPAGTTI